MAQCEHSTWQQYTHRSTLLAMNRLHVLNQLLPHPNEQTLSLITFAGGAVKSRALRSLGIQGPEGLYVRFNQLELTDDAGEQGHLTLLVIYDMSCDWQKPCMVSTQCHEMATRNVHMKREIVLGRLPGIFSNVLVMFLADFSRFINVADFLVGWITSVDQLRAATQPWAIIIRENMVEPFQHGVLSTQLLNNLSKGRELSRSTPRLACSKLRSYHCDSSANPFSNISHHRPSRNPSPSDSRQVYYFSRLIL